MLQHCMIAHERTQCNSHLNGLFDLLFPTKQELSFKKILSKVKEPCCQETSTQRHDLASTLTNSMLMLLCISGMCLLG